MVPRRPTAQTSFGPLPQTASRSSRVFEFCPSQRGAAASAAPAASQTNACPSWPTAHAVVASAAQSARTAGTHGWPSLHAADGFQIGEPLVSAPNVQKLLAVPKRVELSPASHTSVPELAPAQRRPVAAFAGAQDAPSRGSNTVAAS